MASACRNDTYLIKWVDLDAYFVPLGFFLQKEQSYTNQAFGEKSIVGINFGL